MQMKLLPPVYPFAIASFPLVMIYADNIREVAPLEFLAVWTGVMLAVAAVFYLFQFLLADRDRAGLAAMWLPLSLLCYSVTGTINAALELRGIPLFVPGWVAAPLWLVGCATALRFICQSDYDRPAYARFVSIFGMVLVAAGGFSMGVAIAVSPWIWQPAEATPAVVQAVLKPTEPPRDIYYLVFDRYGDKQTLQEEFGHDNAPFLNGLRRRGFHLPASSRANYPKTELSMSAAFNMQLHGDTVWPKVHYRSQLYNNRVAELLHGQGYQHYLLGNIHNGLRRGRYADYAYRFSYTPTELTDNLLRLTPGAAIFPETPHAERSLQKFAEIADIAQQRSGPKFVYAHFMLPHEPWKFDADGSRLTTYQAAQRTQRQNYAAQLAFTNRKIEELVDAILAASPRKPIIVIQADEGPELRYKGDADKSDVAKIKMRTGILTAMLLPGREAATVVPETVSPVNTFRLIFREYFGAKLPLLEDRVFYWSAVNPLGKPELTQRCKFIDVTTQVRGAAPAASPEASAQPTAALEDSAGSAPDHHDLSATD